VDRDRVRALGDDLGEDRAEGLFAVESLEHVLCTFPPLCTLPLAKPSGLIVLMAGTDFDDTLVGRRWRREREWGFVVLVGSDLHLSVERGSGESDGRDDRIDNAPIRIVDGDRIDGEEDEQRDGDAAGEDEDGDEDEEEDEEDLEGDNLRRCRLSEPLIFAEADSNDSRQRFFKLAPFLASWW